MTTRPVVLRDHGYLALPGVSGAYASTPHHADFQLDGDLDLRCEFFQSAPAGSTSLLGRWRDAGDERSYRITTVSIFGFNGLVSSSDGVDATPALSTAVPLNPGAYRATLELNAAGAGTRRVRHYLAPSLDHPWELLHEEVVTGPTVVFTGGVVPLTLGALNDGTFQNLNGGIYQAQLRAGVDGPVRAWPDFRRLPAGTTSFTDSVGKTWTVHGAASVVAGQDFVTL